MSGSQPEDRGSSPRGGIGSVCDIPQRTAVDRENPGFAGVFCWLARHCGLARCRKRGQRGRSLDGWGDLLEDGRLPGFGMEQFMITRIIVLAGVLVSCGCNKEPQQERATNHNQQSAQATDVANKQLAKLISEVEAKERKIIVNSSGTVMSLRENKADLEHETEAAQLAAKYLPAVMEDGKKRVARYIQLQKQAFPQMTDDRLKYEQEKMLGIVKESANSAAASIKKSYVTAMKKSFASRSLQTDKAMAEIHAEKESAIKTKNAQMLAAISRKLDNVENATNARLREDKDGFELEAMKIAREALQEIDKMNDNLEQTIRKNQGK
jgi:hypothetical protein